jgi:hypothetical protein
MGTRPFCHLFLHHDTYMHTKPLFEALQPTAGRGRQTTRGRLAGEV